MSSRVLTTHVGRLQRPDALTERMMARQASGAFDQAAFSGKLKTAVRDVVRQQVEAGITVVNDGEFARVSWLIYAFQWLSGDELRPITATQNLTVLQGKDRSDFAHYYSDIAAESGRTH